MRVVIINSLYAPYIVGGAEISTQILAEALASVADVHVLTLGGQKRGEGVRRERIGGVTVHRLPHGNVFWLGENRRRGKLSRALRRLVDQYNPPLLAAVRGLLGEIRPDLIHTQNLSGFGPAVWTAADPSGRPGLPGTSGACGPPIVHTLRDYSLLSPVSAPLRRPALARLYALTSASFSRRVAAVVGISSHILRRHTEAGLFPGAEQTVIPNAVQGAILAPARSFERGPLTIGYFGRVEPEKGVGELAEAALSLPVEVVERVVICGEGSLKLPLMELIRGDERFRFMGRVNPAEARRMMADVDVSFVPSVWEEPFGRVIIESYQVGTPVYASDVGGIPDVVWHPAEYLFEPGSAAAIRAKIVRFRTKSAEERRYIQAACLEHCGNFTEAAHLQRYMELYRRTLQRGDNGAAAAAALQAVRR